MKTLSFGQPMNGIMQMAYVVPDVRAAVDQWTRELKAGPWYLIEPLQTQGATYRGQPCDDAVANVAFGFAGHMNVELIQPLTDAPGIHRETALRRGYGFHHHGLACADVDADLARYIKRGHKIAFEAPVPTGGKVYYLEGPGDQPGFIELIPFTPLAEAAFTKMWRSSLDWDGRDRLRPFASVL